MPAVLELYDVNGNKIFDAASTRVLRYLGSYKLNYVANGEVTITDDRGYTNTYYRLKATLPFPVNVTKNIAINRNRNVYVRDDYIEQLWYKGTATISTILTNANSDTERLVEVYTY